MTTTARLEHVNLTVKDPLETADLLGKLFDWKIRWQGEALNGGFTVHVGEADSYVALYRHAELDIESEPTEYREYGLNHLGIVVDDLDAIEDRIQTAGFRTHSHGDYEPGRRFYFDTPIGLEIEVISYRVTKS